MDDDALQRIVDQARMIVSGYRYAAEKYQQDPTAVNCQACFGMVAALHNFAEAVAIHLPALYLELQLIRTRVIWHATPTFNWDAAQREADRVEVAALRALKRVSAGDGGIFIKGGDVIIKGGDATPDHKGSDVNIIATNYPINITGGPGVVISRGPAAESELPDIETAQLGEPAAAGTRGNGVEAKAAPEAPSHEQQKHVTQPATPTQPTSQIDADDKRFSRATMSARDLADTYGVDLDALEKRLARWRDKNPDGWVEVENTGSKAPRFLHKLAAVMPVIDAMKASLKRPSKRNLTP